MWTSPVKLSFIPNPQFVLPPTNHVLLQLAWSVLWGNCTRGQQRLASLSRIRGCPLGSSQTSVLKSTQAGPNVSECANTGLHKLPLLSLTCPIWRHSYKSSSCLYKGQEAGGGRVKEFHPHGFGEARDLTCFNRVCFPGPGKLHLCNFASRLTKKVLNADSQK